MARSYVVCHTTFSTRAHSTPYAVVRVSHYANSHLVLVSQFTLLASTKKGNKPDFHRSASAAKGKELYDSFFSQVRSLYREDRVKDGVFQAMMDVGLVNDGPVGVDFRCIDEAVCMPHFALILQLLMV